MRIHRLFIANEAFLVGVTRWCGRDGFPGTSDSGQDKQWTGYRAGDITARENWMRCIPTRPTRSRGFAGQSSSRPSEIGQPSPESATVELPRETRAGQVPSRRHGNRWRVRGI